MQVQEPGSSPLHQPIPKYATEGISFNVSPHMTRAEPRLNMVLHATEARTPPPKAAPLDTRESESESQNHTGLQKLASQVKDTSVSGFKKAVKYVPRFSFFAAENEASVKDPFRGFYMLFWICLGTQVLNAFVRSYESTGSILSMTLAMVMSRDLLMLAISDAVLVGHTFFCVALIKFLHRYSIARGFGLLIFQCVWYLTVMVSVIVWIRVRQWPWTQSGFFVLHAMVQLMKIHSYVDVNSIMNDDYMKLMRYEQKLMDRVVELEGNHGVLDRHAAWEKAILKVTEHLHISPDADRLSVYDQLSPLKQWLELDMQKGSSDVRAQVLLPSIFFNIPRSRSPIPEHRRLVNAVTESNNEYLDIVSLPPMQTDLHDVHPLIWHPDPILHDIAKEISTIREALYAPVIPGQGIGPMWPNSVSVANFWDFQLVPSLVYQLQYPRQDSIRPWYIMERCFALLGSFFVIYVITVNWIIPVTEEKGASLISVFLRLAAPMMACALPRLPGRYEWLTPRFADREFYRDWWNSTSMEEFARDWNRHVYVSLIFQVGLKKSTASILAFLISSIFHEIVMIVVSGKIRGYLFIMQMSQYPLILMGRVRFDFYLRQTEFIRKRPAFGNFLFWFGLMIGFPALNILYLMF